MHWAEIETNSYWLLAAASFLIVAILESFRPKRRLTTRVERRWSRHGMITILGTLVLAGVYRISPVLMAVTVADSRLGLLNRRWLPVPVRFILGVLLIDVVRYGVHRCYHSVQCLWRLHQVHHSDPDFDVSTGFRAHPLEVTLTQGVTLVTVAILAPPVAAVLIVELAYGCQSFLEHANLALPMWFEKRLRWVLVTSDMHRVHHSEEILEQSRNLGDLFSWWDRIFGTYLAEPAAGHAGMTIGLRGFQGEGSLGLPFMLMQPFRRGQVEAVAQRTVAASGD
jgi:sterol desaturase/sphingolipid hydroxylase (fatty acid hydroxylase superfamily)